MGLQRVRHNLATGQQQQRTSNAEALKGTSGYQSPSAAGLSHLHKSPRPGQDLLAGVVHPQVGSPLLTSEGRASGEKEKDLVINTLFS